MYKHLFGVLQNTVIFSCHFVETNSCMLTTNNQSKLGIIIAQWSLVSSYDKVQYPYRENATDHFLRGNPPILKKHNDILTGLFMQHTLLLYHH